MALYTRTLRAYGLTPTAFARLDESEQAFMLGYELYRQRQLAEWRKALIGDGDKSNLTPEAATMLMMHGL